MAAKQKADAAAHLHAKAVSDTKASKDVKNSAQENHATVKNYYDK